MINCTEPFECRASQRKLIETLISEVRLYPKETREKGKNPVKIKYVFPVSGEVLEKMQEKVATVETVVLLSKEEIDSKKLRIEFSLEDMDISGFRKGATYQEIKDYVKEQTGLSASDLYIAQIKRKCGLDVGQNYNLTKKENAKVPQCPQEKEETIRAALKYFKMI